MILTPECIMRQKASSSPLQLWRRCRGDQLSRHGDGDEVDCSVLADGGSHLRRAEAPFFFCWSCLKRRDSVQPCKQCTGN